MKPNKNYFFLFIQNTCWNMAQGKDLTSTEKHKITVCEWEYVHFGDIKGVLQKSSNDKEDSWKYNQVENSKQRKKL